TTAGKRQRAHGILMVMLSQGTVDIHRAVIEIHTPRRLITKNPHAIEAEAFSPALGGEHDILVNRLLLREIFNIPRMDRAERSAGGQPDRVDHRTDRLVVQSANDSCG